MLTSRFLNLLLGKFALTKCDWLALMLDNFWQKKHSQSTSEESETKREVQEDSNNNNTFRLIWN